MRLLLLTFAAAAIAQAAPASSRPPFDAPILPDRDLANMRGGMRLPNGFNVAIGFDIQTRLDGVVMLRTLYASDGPHAGVRVFTGGAVAPDRTGHPMARLAASINLVKDIAKGSVTDDGSSQVPVEANGPAFDSGAGNIALTENELGAMVRFQSQGVEIRHLVGQASGVVVANTANNRVIDTISSINIDLESQALGMLPHLFAIDRTAFDAATIR